MHVTRSNYLAEIMHPVPCVWPWKLIYLPWTVAALQRSVHHWPERGHQAPEHQRPARGAQRGRDAAPGQGLPVRGDTRRGVPGQLDSKLPNGESCSGLSVILLKIAPGLVVLAWRAGIHSDVRSVPVVWTQSCYWLGQFSVCLIGSVGCLWRKLLVSF